MSNPTISAHVELGVDGAPSELHLGSLRVGVITNSREELKDLGGAYDGAGVYLLFGPASIYAPLLARVIERTDALDGPAYRCYIGKASNVRRRVSDHVSSRGGLSGQQFWTRGLCIVGAAGHEMTSADAGYLEERLVALFAASADAELVNRNRPREGTLSPERAAELDKLLVLVTSAAALVGYPQRQTWRGALAEDDARDFAGFRRGLLLWAQRRLLEELKQRELLHPTRWGRDRSGQLAPRGRTQTRSAA